MIASQPRSVLCVHAPLRSLKSKKFHGFCCCCCFVLFCFLQICSEDPAKPKFGQINCNHTMVFGRKRALYQLIGSKKAQIQTLRDHIKKSNHRTNFSFVINLIIRVSSYYEEIFRKFPLAVWTEESGFVHNSKNFEYPNNQLIQKMDIQMQTLRDPIKNRMEGQLFLL